MQHRSQSQDNPNTTLYMFMCGRRFNPLDGPPNASSSDEGDDVETTSLGGNSSFEEEEEEDDDAVFSRYPGLKKQETALAAMEKQQVFNFRSGMDCYQTFP